MVFVPVSQCLLLNGTYGDARRKKHAALIEKNFRRRKAFLDHGHGTVTFAFGLKSKPRHASGRGSGLSTNLVKHRALAKH